MIWQNVTAQKMKRRLAGDCSRRRTFDMLDDCAEMIAARRRRPPRIDSAGGCRNCRRAARFPEEVPFIKCGIGREARQFYFGHWAVLNYAGSIFCAPRAKTARIYDDDDCAFIRDIRIAISPSAAISHADCQPACYR